MKTKLIFLTVLIAAFSAVRAQGPQVPNGNFAITDTIVLAAPDTIYDSTGTIIDSIIPGQYYLTPDQWATIDGSLGQPLGFSFVDMNDVPPGAPASLALITDTLAGQGTQEGTIVSFASLGTATFLGQGFSYTGVPFIFKPDTLFFSYQYTSAGGGADTAGATFNITGTYIATVIKHDTTTGRDTITHPILDTTVSITTPLILNSNWSNVAMLVDTFALDSFVPNTLLIQFLSSIAQNPVIGDTLRVGNVYFGYANAPVETVRVIGSSTFCEGDSAILSAPTNAAYSYYQWYENGSPIPGANTSFLTAYDSSSYYVIIDSLGAPAQSIPVSLNVIQAPAVSLIVVSGSDTSNTVCLDSSNVGLSGYPYGGRYTGVGVTDTTFYPFQVGTFAVNYAYTDTSTGCAATVTDSINVTICTGVTEVKQRINLNVYPNPASQILNLVSDNNLSGYTMQLFDVVGQKVTSQAIEGFGAEVNISALVNGMYVVRIVNQHGVIATEQKVVILK